MSPARCALLAGAVLLAGNAMPARAQGAGHAPVMACGDLSRAATSSVTIDSAVEQPAGPFDPGGRGGARQVDLPAHCLVTGTIDRRIGVGGKPYAIHFEMRLPLVWNGRFLFQGGGGINGVVNPALGNTKGPSALARGFAVVTQDAGHQTRDASFGEDQQARLDMIERSYIRVTGEAKRLVTTFYGRPPEHSYFMGCSEGGREALLASQRMPQEYDGVVAGDPGLLLGVYFDDVAGRMALARIAPKGTDGRPDLSKAFSVAQLSLLKRAVEEDCDGLDGLKDGIIANAPACRPHLERLLCPQGGSDCLSKQQLAVLRAIFDGGLPAGDHVIAKGYYFNNQLDLPMWRDKLAGFGGLPTPPVSSLQGLFVTPYDPSFDDFGVDFARDGARFDEVGSLNRTDAVTYSSFAARGSKLLVYTGLADPAFSAKTLVDWFGRMQRANGGAAAQSFARLFLVPGMLHCRGGMALDDFDPLGAVVDWVEHGRAPERLIVTGSAFPGRSRPLCAWPAQAHYRGTGVTQDAASFECRQP
jgi:hypothetical protein